MAASPSTKGSMLYVAGTSFMHRLNPVTKLTLVLWVAVSAFLLPPLGTLVLLLALILTGMAAGAGKVFAKRLALTLLPLALALFVVHGLLIDHANRIEIGPMSVSLDGLAFMGKIICRIGALLSGSLLFVTTTHPAVLLKALDAKGFSPAISYLIASPLLLLEPFNARARSIREAQQARGLDLDGSLKARLAAFRALLMPLITLALSDIDHRASVLDGRGFRAVPRRTVINPPADSATELWLRRLMLAAIPVELIIWAALKWL